jgi:acyl-CoA synthetase (AMP-forming)/AMP-acid ligase II
MTGVSGLVEAGLDRATLITGREGASLRGREMAERGALRFGDGATAPAVAAMLTNDAPTIEIVLGAMITGTRLVSLPLPPRGGDILAHAALIRDAAAAHGVERVVARDDVAELLSSVGIAAVGHSALDGEVLARPQPDGFELVQFTSGSTGRPKGIRLSDATLGENVRAILDAVAPQPGDVAVSWLPLAHDMGLIGMLLTSLAASSPALVGDSTIVVLEPEAFLRRPSSWLEAIDHWRGSFTAAPDFGFRLAVERRSPHALDLSSLRCAITGGEVVRAGTLESVEATFGAEGLRREALCPAYGMAEIGLAAAISRPGEPWVGRTFRTEALARGELVSAADGGTTLVSSGRAITGYEVIAVTDGDDRVGPLSVVAPGAGVDALSDAALVDATGRLATGDLGFVTDELVFVCGRNDDHLVVHGRSVYAPTIEEAVSGVVGVRQGRVTAVDAPTGEWVVVVEGDREWVAGRGDAGRLRADVRRAVVTATSVAPDDVVVLAPGELPMTSSGKLQRHLVRARWIAGDLDAGGSDDPS